MEIAISKSIISIPEEIIQKWQNLVDITAESIDAPVVLISKAISPHMQIMCANKSPGNPYQTGTQLLLADHYCGTVVAAGSKLMVADANKENNQGGNAALRLGFISYLGFPIRWPDGEMFGVFCTLDRKQRVFGIHEEGLLTQFNEAIEAHLAAVYQNRRVELIFESLGDTGEGVPTIIEKAADAIVTTDRDGDIIYWNYGAQILFDYTSAEARGKPMTLIVAERFREAYQAEIEKASEQTGMERKIFRWTGLRKSGTEIPIEITQTTWRRGDELFFTAVVHSTSERKVLGEIIQRRNQELATLNKVAQTVSQSLKLDDVLTRTLDIILGLFNLSSGGIYLNDESSGKPILTVSKGLSEDLTKLFGKAKPGVVSFRTGVAEYDKQTAPSISEGQIGTSPHLPSNSAKMQYVLTLPLKSRGRELGMIAMVMESQGGFPDESIQLLESISNQVAIAVENARLYEKANQLSITDELTGLYNRRHFDEVLQSEIARHERYGGSLVLGMLDLDGFKQYNDEFGHPAGDSLLRLFSQTLSSTLRKTDIIFRYGGDEFAIILPGTNSERARNTVGRIQAKWSELIEEYHTIIPDFLGFSAGISQFPDNAGNCEMLTSLADSALYYSKRHGKNKCTLASEIKE